LEFFHVRTDRVWTRDYGPIFVHPHPYPPPTLGERTGGGLVATDWHFNGWAKYENWRRDNAVTWKLCKTLGLRRVVPKLAKRPIVLEGGSIDVNGQGLLLTTEECLLSETQQRNPGVERGDLERLFADYLGIRKVLWL